MILGADPIVALTESSKWLFEMATVGTINRCELQKNTSGRFDLCGRGQCAVISEVRKLSSGVVFAQLRDDAVLDDESLVAVTEVTALRALTPSATIVPI